MPNVTVLPGGTSFVVPEGTNLLEVLRERGLAPDAPCGGRGTCGKCLVSVNGREVQACQTLVTEDCEVAVPETADVHVLEDGTGPADAPVVLDPIRAGDLLAVDLGTTTVVAYLLDGTTGAELARGGMLNPQAPFGADVISRIEAARTGRAGELRDVLTKGLCGLVEQVCAEAGRDPAAIGVVAVVGNPAMQQLFLGLPVDNLAAVPFAPVLTRTDVLPAADHLACCPEASLLVVPDIGGYIGADTVGCLLATRLWETGRNSLLIDIGTNGEMVLSAGGKLAACSTAAGPALEGAKVRFGMRSAPGAIDRARVEDGHIAVHTIEDKVPAGICGSGLIDAVAAALDLHLINKRGRILSPEERDGERFIALTDTVYLTQNDIREVMLAKGAIAAGVELLAEHLGLAVEDIDEVLLAGAFGSFLDPDSACRIGLLPETLRGKARSVGNAAGAGARCMACSREAFEETQRIVDAVESVELANLDDFMSCFARNMNFRESDAADWKSVAKACGFDAVYNLDVSTLQTETWVRDTCAANKCHAYDTNWTCPPACGTLEECEARMRQYGRGVLLQVTGRQKSDIDVQCYLETEQRLQAALEAFADKLRSEHPDALVLGAGACRVCADCAYPDPCRFPEKAMSSMEAYGLFVTRVCKDNGAEYNYGPKTITYTACVLY